MKDVRDAWRALRATPVVSLVAVLSLALGIGANTAIFSILDSLLLRSLPVREPHRLALMRQEGQPASSWTNPIWEQVRDRQQLFDGAMAWSSTRFNLAQGGQSEMIDGVWVSGRYFEVLGVNSILGRTIREADDRRGGGPDGPVTVIGYNFWQRRFGGAADVVGKSITIERVPFTIVGVTPSEFFGADVGRTFDAAIPLGTEPLIRGKESALDRRSWWWMNVMIRRKANQSLDAATSALRGVQPQIREATMPQDWRPGDLKQYLAERFTLQDAATGSSGLRRRYQRPLTTIMVVVSLVLLIACANIANLQLARGTARRHELSVRLALGASRGRLVRQLLTESLLLAGAGAAAGLLFARWGSGMLVRQLSTQVNNVFLDLSLDWRVLGFTAGVGAATAVLFGTVPAFRATRVQPMDALKAQGREPSGEGRTAFGNTLVVVQVALSLVLVLAAGLFVQTFARLATLDLGFDRDRLLVVNANAQGARVEPADRPALYSRVREALLAVPGVSNAAMSAVTPVSGYTWTWRIDVERGPALNERERTVHVNLVSPGFFNTMGTTLKAGRDFGAHDSAGSPPVVIVNEAFARKFTSGSNPIGRTILQTGGPKPVPPREIVGLVEDAVYRSLRDPVPPTMYVPFAQIDESTPVPSVSFTVRSASESPALLTRTVAAAIGRVDADLALTFRLLSDQVRASLIQERLVAMLSAFFGGLALLLAGLGLYGVMSYAVSRRRTEIGIRMALGAAPARVVRMVLGRVGLLVGLGVVIGSGASLWAARFVGALLYGLQPRDPITFAIGAAVLIGVGALAGWLPARRASRIDPARVLREG